MDHNLTSLFLGDEATWGEARVVVASVQGLWGGHIIVVEGRGAATVRLIGPGARHERHFELPLSPSEALTLLRLLVARDLLAIEPPPRQWLLPDEATTTITLHKGSRRSYTLTVWANDPPHPDLAAILAGLLGKVKATDGMQPVYEGEYRG